MRIRKVHEKLKANKLLLGLWAHVFTSVPLRCTDLLELVT